MKRQASWLERTARGMGLASVDELAASDPDLFKRLTSKWRAIQKRSADGKMLQTGQIHAIANRETHFRNEQMEAVWWGWAMK